MHHLVWLYVIRVLDKGIIMLCLYVDDLLITRSNEKLIHEFKKDMKKEFEMTDLGLLTYFLGIQFMRTSRQIIMHQIRHAREILKKFEMEH